VRRPKHVVKTGKTPVLEGTEWRKLLKSIPDVTLRDLRPLPAGRHHRSGEALTRLPKIALGGSEFLNFAALQHVSRRAAHTCAGCSRPNIAGRRREKYDLKNANVPCASDDSRES